jgi:hypothetical protein
MTIEHNPSQPGTSKLITIDTESSLSKASIKLKKKSVTTYKKIQLEIMKEYANGFYAFEANCRLYRSMPKKSYVHRIKNLNDIFQNTDEESGSEITKTFLMALIIESNYYKSLFRLTEQSYERKEILDKVKETDLQITPYGLASTTFNINAVDDTDSIALVVKSFNLRSEDSTRTEATKLTLKYIHDSNPALRQTAVNLSRIFQIGECCTNIYHNLISTRKTLFCFNKLFGSIHIIGKGNCNPIELVTPGYPYLEFSVQKISAPLEIFASGELIDAFLYKDPTTPPLLNKLKFLKENYFKNQIMLYRTIYRKQIKLLDPTIIPIDKFEKGYANLANKIDKLVLSLKPIVSSSSTSKEFKFPTRSKVQRRRKKSRGKKTRTQAKRRVTIVTTPNPVKLLPKKSETKVELTQKPVESRFSLFTFPSNQPFKYHERITRWRGISGEKNLDTIRGFIDRGEYNYADQSAENLLTQIRRHDFTLTIDRLLSSTKFRKTYAVKTSNGWAFLAEIETKSSSGKTVRERGMISYGTYQVTGKPDVCYHRYFHPVTTQNIFAGEVPTMMQKIASTHKYDDDSDDQLISDLSDGFDGEQIRIHNEFQYVEILDKKREMVLRVFAMNTDD